MEEEQIMLAEYNNLWQEKVAHKQSIRKFHNYLTYITAIGSLALTFHGVSTEDFVLNSIKPAGAAKPLEIILMFFVAYAPVLFITLTFPLNDLFQIYVIGTHIGQLELRINTIKGNRKVLFWEHSVCPIIFGGKLIEGKGSPTEKVTNLIRAGDNFLFVPLLLLLSGITTWLGYKYLLYKLGYWYAIPYLCGVSYMAIVLIILGRKLYNYTLHDGLLKKTIEYIINEEQ
jgi:ABC-type multidrug transport system fused ATPase/permease subunit